MGLRENLPSALAGIGLVEEGAPSIVVLAAFDIGWTDQLVSIAAGMNRVIALPDQDA